MNETDLLRGKREQFHTEIRRNQLEKIFNLKRKVSNSDSQLSDYYAQQMQQMGKIKLLDLLILINEKVNKPIVEMLQNDLGFQLCKLLNLNELYSNWDLFKNILTYLNILVLLPDEHLHNYPKFNDMLISFSQLFILLEAEIFRQGLCIKGNDQNCPLEAGYDEISRLSYSFIKVDQILMYSSTTFEARGELLRSKLFTHSICHAFHNQMDNCVLELHLQLIASLLQDLYKQDNDCRKHAEVFIKPVCTALSTKNLDKLNYLLQILLNLTFVGMHNGYINQIFKFNGALELMQILNEGFNDQLTLRILAEIATQSPAHIEILIKNGLLQQLKLKLCSNNKLVQNQALWVLEFCVCGGKQFYDLIFLQTDITNYVFQLLDSKDEQIRIQACFTLCAYLLKGNYQQTLQLCQSKVHIKVFEFLQLENVELNQAILEAVVEILNKETWHSSQYVLMQQSDRENLRYILERLEEDQSIFSMINNVLSYL
ncbi:unnamed protein product (macronuclear) [Paramecium tetraurelia]|uniref:Uncharacterized protein n=1 Tax=Paramecium tetraurelia TaxID=5888 RepID=A0CBP5_PARTE|nr:uncharacterized protein GSPATT00036995001 [Paramecium tetraurelia]CAK68212.1 unnamed protein product [Paramecium tetraurelia]|eukprot:XP_001435609.1 hypothetical protein (macronuclear) [Paramecium tetraurelia strain d4-2]